MNSLITPSTSETLDVFLSFPLSIHKRIMSFLTPLDYLRLSDTDPKLRRFVTRLPKVLLSIDDFCDISIEGWNGQKQAPTYRRQYVTNAQQWRGIQMHLKWKPTGPNIEHIYLPDISWEERKEREKRDRNILLENATMDTVSTDIEMMKLNIRTKHIYPTGSCDEILRQIEKTEASELHFPFSDFTSEQRIQFFNEPLIRRLSAINTNLSFEELKFIEKFQAKRLEIWIEDQMKTENLELLVDVARNIVEKLQKSEREIDFFRFQLPKSHRILPNEISEDLTDPLNEEYNKLSKRVSEGFSGGFEKEAVFENVQLISRDDGKGLLLYSGACCFLIAETDYAIRSKRGLGNKMERQNKEMEKNRRKELGTIKKTTNDFDGCGLGDLFDIAPTGDEVDQTEGENVVKQESATNVEEQEEERESEEPKGEVVPQRELNIDYIFYGEGVCISGLHRTMMTRTWPGEEWNERR